MRKIFFYLLLATSILKSFPLFAQTYADVIHLSGTQIISGTNVTVVPSLLGTGSGYHCGQGPYWIGTLESSGNYTFQFATAVEEVRIRVTAMNVTEQIMFQINGVAYTLSAGNIHAYFGTCNQAQSLLSAGNLLAPTVMSSAIGAGAEVRINGIINSVTVMTPPPQGEGGSIFGLSFLVPLHTSSNAPLCNGTTLQLSATPSHPNATYSWDGPNGFNSTIQNPTIPFVQEINEGYYILTCFTMYGDTLIDSTFVDVVPIPEAAISHNMPVCLGHDLNFTATTLQSGITFEWTGPAGFNEQIQNPTIANVQHSNAGEYMLITSNGICYDTTKAPIVVNDAAHSSIEAPICSHESYNFNGVMMNMAGEYSDTLLAENGCDSIVFLHLKIRTSPEVKLEFYKEQNLCVGDTVSLFAEGATFYNWYLNDNLLVGNTDMQRLSMSNAMNELMLIGNDEHGCKDTASLNIEATPCCDLFIPNAFSPNEDNVNDKFGVTARGSFYNFQMHIYNRWGQRIFTGSNPDQHWNGYANMQLVETGIYYYQIIAECPDGQVSKSGELHLIR